MCGQLTNSNVESVDKLVLQLVGDIVLNGRFCDPMYHEPMRENLSQLADDMGRCDLRIGNFEAPLWGGGGVNRLKSPRICTTAEAAKCILPLGLDVALLANNHVYDCLEKGFENTISFLRENNIRHVGAGQDPDQAAQPLIVGRKDLRIAILNYVCSDTHPNIPADAGVFLNMFDEERVLCEVGELSKEVDIVLLCLHCGAVEFMRLPTVGQRSFARRAVEAGATIVACEHAHCLQPNEGWKGGHIFYGLGNLIFGDAGGRALPEAASRTAVATVVLSRDGIERVRLKYLCWQNLKLKWDKRKSRQRMQARLNRRIRLRESVYRVVYGWELFYQQVIISYLRFLKRSGGLIPSLFKIRKRHFAAFIKELSGRVGK